MVHHGSMVQAGDNSRVSVHVHFASSRRLSEGDSRSLPQHDQGLGRGDETWLCGEKFD